MTANGGNFFNQYISAFTQSRIQSNLFLLKWNFNTFLPLSIWTSCVEWDIAYHSSIISSQSSYFYTHIQYIRLHDSFWAVEAEDVIAHSLLQWKHEAVCFGEHLRWAQWKGFTFMSIQAVWLGLKNTLLFSYKRWQSRPKLNICLHRPPYEAQIASCQFSVKWKAL